MRRTEIKMNENVSRIIKAIVERERTWYVISIIIGDASR
jgi:hypothetical protein